MANRPVAIVKENKELANMALCPEPEPQPNDPLNPASHVVTATRHATERNLADDVHNTASFAVWTIRVIQPSHSLEPQHRGRPQWRTLLYPTSSPAPGQLTI